MCLGNAMALSLMMVESLRSFSATAMVRFNWSRLKIKNEYQDEYMKLGRVKENRSLCWQRYNYT
jgi:hypothetical protein